MKKLNLRDYTLLTASFIQLHNAQAEVSYIDFEPDIVLDDPGELYLLDFDTDGVEDFRFIHHKGVYFTYWGSQLRYFDAIFAGAVDDGNWIAGSYHTYGSAAYSSYVTYHPYFIPFGYPIGVMLSFQEDYSQLVGAAIANDEGTIIDYKGNWGEGAEGYLGIRIERGLNYYYGWIRVTVADSSKTFTIHDLAFENAADKAIIAGDSLGTLPIESPSPVEPIIYCDGRDLHFNPGAYSNSSQHELRIFDLSGKMIYFLQLNNTAQIVHLDFTPGNYIACYSNSNEMVSVKFAKLH